MPSDLWKMSAVDQAQGLQARDFTAVELLDSVLGRVSQHNPQLNAITVDCSAEAREQAQRADAAIERGESLGPLHGVPLTIKENVDQTGCATTNGIPAFEHLIAEDDSPIVANFKAAGAVIIGRTNTPELSMRATTDNPLRGRTRNPWHEDKSPGGSSGGAGASAAAGFGAIHHGNDIGGSLRFPSFCCGVSTVKPTQGRVPAYNPSAPAERGMLAQLMSVQGAICREVKDVRLATKVMAQDDPRDPWWVPAPFDTWPEEPVPVIGYTLESYGYSIDSEIKTAVMRVVDCLREAGLNVQEVKTPSVHDAAQSWFDVAAYEIRETLGPIAAEHGSETINNIFDWYCSLGNLVDADGYRVGIAERTRLTREWNVFLQQYPLVLTPLLMQPNYHWNYDAQSEANTHDLFQSSIYSCGINYLGLPAGVFPAGEADGAPCGVQLIGRRFREDQILDVMQRVEDSLGVPAFDLWGRMD